MCNDKALGKEAKIPKGAIRFWYRHKDGQAEKSMHVKCVLNQSFLWCSTKITRGHIDHSVTFLKRYEHSSSFSEKLREPMKQALDVLETLVGDDSLCTKGAGGSSGSG